jgi:hypothetical protein
MGELSAVAGRPVVDVVLAHAPAMSGAVNGQWLGQAALYMLYASLGETGLRLAAGLLISTALGFVLVTARIAGPGPRTAALAVLLATVLAASNVAVRAQLFSYALFALASLLLHLRYRRPSLLWALPPLFTLWANLHGAFALGLLLVALYAVGDLLDAGIAKTRRRASQCIAGRLALIAIVSGAAAAVNPLGPGVYAYVVEILNNPSIKTLVEEWRPTTIQEPTGLALAASGLLLFVVLRASRGPLAATEVLVLLTFGYLALTSLRNVVWWGIVLAPILARHSSAVRLPTWRIAGSTARQTETQSPALFNLALAGVLLTLATLSPLWRPGLVDQVQGNRSSSNYAPAGTADFMTGLPNSRLFNYQPWTGYLAWRLWPAHVPMVDGRVEAHPSSVWGDYLAVSSAVATWESILDRYGVDLLVLHPWVQRDLAEAATATRRWTRIYQDDAAIVLARLP